MIDSRILQMMLAKGVGDTAIRKFLLLLAEKKRTLEEVFSSKNNLFEFGFNQQVVDNIFACETEQSAHKMAKELADRGVTMLTLLDDKYPKTLKCANEMAQPPVLFAKGNVDLLNNPSVGFCGSRKASLKGINITADCAKQLVEQKITVVSGYASGTDLAAHSTALRQGGNTVFVLAEGILRYTVKNEVRDLLKNDNHVFVSQFLPTMTWNAGNAMKRNGIIIGLSQAMILVESGKTGGTFAAGEESLKRGCPLFVIDFAKPEVSAEANPYFIEAGGFPIRGKKGIPCLEEVLSAVKNRYAILANVVKNKRTVITIGEQLRINI